MKLFLEWMKSTRDIFCVKHGSWSVNETFEIIFKHHTHNYLPLIKLSIVFFHTGNIFYKVKYPKSAYTYSKSNLPPVKYTTHSNTGSNVFNTQNLIITSLSSDRCRRASLTRRNPFTSSFAQSFTPIESGCMLLCKIIEFCEFK